MNDDVLQVMKSSRHSKITGDFAERLILYWLSKYDFECAYVDHVGLDIIARNLHTPEVLGISVKSRSRARGMEGEYVKIPIENLMKLEKAAKAFNCTPYFAVVVDEFDIIHSWILPMSHLIHLHPQWRKRTQIGWKMTRRAIEAYAGDPKIMRFVLSTTTNRWWN
jgi:Holliday junction resolvase-like predicted endonuclease